MEKESTKLMIRKINKEIIIIHDTTHFCGVSAQGKVMIDLERWEKIVKGDVKLSQIQLILTDCSSFGEMVLCSNEISSVWSFWSFIH